MIQFNFLLSRGLSDLTETRLCFQRTPDAPPDAPLVQESSEVAEGTPAPAESASEAAPASPEQLNSIFAGITEQIKELWPALIKSLEELLNSLKGTFGAAAPEAPQEKEAPDAGVEAGVKLIAEVSELAGGPFAGFFPVDFTKQRYSVRPCKGNGEKQVAFVRGGKPLDPQKDVQVRYVTGALNNEVQEKVAKEKVAKAKDNTLVVVISPSDSRNGKVLHQETLAYLKSLGVDPAKVTGVLIEGDAVEKKQLTKSGLVEKSG